MTNQSQVAENDTVVKERRERIKPGGKLVENRQTSCPYCGKSGKAHRIETHIQTCHKRPQ